jgi:hypothetical protein
MCAQTNPHGTHTPTTQAHNAHMTRVYTKHTSTQYTNTTHTTQKKTHNTQFMPYTKMCMYTHTQPGKRKIAYSSEKNAKAV